MADKMKITLLGPAHPFRGGLVAIMQTMARLYQQQGHEVLLRTFTVQYPEWLFPGKTQYAEGEGPTDLKIERALHTANPLNWIRQGLRLKRERPDMVLLKYWTPFMAPLFGTVARLARRNGHTKFICQIDNVEPHEHHWFDGLLNRWFLGAMDGFVYMSEQVHGELKHYTSAPALFSPHPMFENYGEPVARTEACNRLGLDPKQRYALYFGLIRDYKGLDWLLEAWGRLKREGRLPEGLKLVVAGEFYTDPAPYLRRMAQEDLKGEVILMDRFIPDEEVKYLFSAADFLLLPYKSATQSGVTQIAYRFRLPVMVTRVGGLAEIVPHDRVGQVADPTIEAICQAIERLCDPATQARYREAMAQEAKRFSWEEMCLTLEKVYNLSRNSRPKAK